jgi:hypothetical protein
LLQNTVPMQSIVFRLSALQSVWVRNSNERGSFSFARQTCSIQCGSSYRSMPLRAHFPLIIMRDAGGLGFRSCHGGFVT